MPIHPMSSVTTLVIPLFFTLAVLLAPPVAGAPPADEPGAVRGVCTGSFCALVRPAPQVVDEPTVRDEQSTADGRPAAPLFVSPSDPELCGRSSPASLSSAG